MAKSSTSYKKGQSGKRNGAPTKEYSITNTMKRMLEIKRTIINKDTGAKEKIIPREFFVDRIIQIALKGDMAAARLIWNYIDGMPEQKIKSDLAGDVNINLISKKEDNI